MPAIVKTYSPDVRRWAAKLQRQRTPSVSRWGRHVCLHRIAWTQALIARFVHFATPVRGMERTPLRGTWAWMQRSHWFAPQIQLAWHTSVAATWQGRDRTLLMPLSPPPSERTTLLQTVLTREYWSRSTTLLRSTLLRHLTQSHLQEITRHTLATLVVERTAPGAMSRWLVDPAVATQKSAGAVEPEARERFGKV